MTLGARRRRGPGRRQAPPDWTVPARKPGILELDDGGRSDRSRYHSRMQKLIPREFGGPDVTAWAAIHLDWRFRTDGTLNARPITAGWDTGASHTVIDDDLARELFDARTGSVDGQLTLDAHAFDPLEMRVVELSGAGVDVLVGHSFFARHRVLFDFPRSMLYVERSTRSRERVLSASDPLRLQARPPTLPAPFDPGPSRLDRWRPARRGRVSYTVIMPDAISRIPRELRRELARLSRQQKRPASDIVREALRRHVAP